MNSSKKTWAEIVEQSSGGSSGSVAKTSGVQFDIIGHLSQNENLKHVTDRIFKNLDETMLFTAALVHPTWFKLARPYLVRYVHIYYNRIYDGGPFQLTAASNWDRTILEITHRGSAPDLVVLILTLKEMITKGLKYPDPELTSCKKTTGSTGGSRFLIL